MCIARKWCVRRGVNGICVLASVCRATLCSTLSKAPLNRGGPSDRTLKPLEDYWLLAPFSTSGGVFPLIGVRPDMRVHLRQLLRRLLVHRRHTGDRTPSDAIASACLALDAIVAAFCV